MKKIYSLIFSLIVPVLAFSQASNVNYFVESATDRHNLNPALVPYTGYIRIPAIGNLGVNVESNLAVNNLLYQDGNRVYTFLHPDVPVETALAGFRNVNNINMDIDTDIISFGFFTKRNSFWTFDLGVRANVDGMVSKEYFRFLKEGMTRADGTYYDLSGLGATVTANLEASLGYSFRLLDGLRLGVKLKGLVGLARMDIDVDRMDVNMSRDKWTIDSRMKATMYAPMVTMGVTEDGMPAFSGDGRIAPAGFGAAIDLGAEYKFGGILKGLSVYGAVTDLGFMIYDNSMASRIGSESVVEYDGFKDIDIENMNLEDQVNEVTGMFYDMLRMEEQQMEEGKSVSMLSARFNVGAEYAILKNRISFGLLYTGYVGTRTYRNELTVSANFRPAECFAFTASYSMLNSFNSIGLALHLTPSAGLSFFIATDCMVLDMAKITVPLSETMSVPAVLPMDRTVLNMRMGINIPIQGRFMKKMRSEQVFM